MATEGLSSQEDLVKEGGVNHVQKVFKFSGWEVPLEIISLGGKQDPTGEAACSKPHSDFDIDA